VSVARTVLSESSLSAACSVKIGFSEKFIKHSKITIMVTIRSVLKAYIYSSKIVKLW
jgi:hypothetical protein